MKRKRPSNPVAPKADDRVQRSKKAVLTTTFQLLSETGLSGVSIDAVSKRSGVAKTTIYRHWPSRSALLLEACANMGTKPQAPDTGSFKRDLTTMVTESAHRLRTAAWATVLPSIVDAAERDRQLAEVQASIHSQIRSAFRTIIERAQKKGEVSSSLDPGHIIASILGPLFYRRWFSREPLDEAFVNSLVGSVVGMSKAHP